MSSNSTEAQENICVVCFKNIEIYSIGSCDHTVCYECSTRMRVLCQQNECPICRQELPKVVFVSSVRPFSDLQHYTLLQDKKYKICFENGKIQDAFYKLLEHNCSVCPNSPSFRSFHALYDHMRREHELYYCDLCVEHLKIFTSERRCYTRAELAQHRRKGDSDDRSHRGHPLCKFCDVRFMDNDCLYRHLRREHLFCHFCDADGYDLYYSSYDYLRDHFRDEHYLCEEGACVDEKFTPVFRTEIDLKAHKASVHGRTMGKAAAKQARTLELEFTLKPRVRQDAARRGKSRGYCEMGHPPEEGAVGGSEHPASRSESPTLSPSEFPSLPSGSGSTTIIAPAGQQRGRTAGLTIHAVGRRNTPLEITDENFPVLGLHNESTSQGTSVRLNINQDRTSASGRSTITPRNVSIHFNHRANGEQNIRIRQDDFPALSSDSKSNRVPAAKWVVSSKKPNSSSMPTQQRPMSLDCEFPSLNARFNANLNLKPNEASKSNSKSSKENKTEEKKIKKASSVMIPVRNEWVEPPDTSTNSLKNKTKKKKTKSSNNNEEKADTAKKKEENDVKKKIVNDNNLKTDSSALSKTSNQKSVKPLPTAEDWFEGCKKRDKRQTEDEDEENWFDNNVSLGTTKLNLNDFPSLGKVTDSKIKSKAPPGFDNINGYCNNNDVRKPPPGFSMDLPRHNGLTFTNSSGQSYAISANFDYTPPNDFERRNKNLITKVNEILLNDVNLKEFRKMSALFRQDKLSADEYYEHCIKTMGELGFHEIFPELLVLLPDINKQQELFQVYSRIKNLQKGKRKLETCEICRQVVSSCDYKHHLAQHSLQQNFPLLSADHWTK